MSNRVESQLPSIFYHYIDDVSDDLWLKFVRLLGLGEPDIQSASSKHSGFQEKKYQILTRWKMYLGTLRDDQFETILKLTQEEVDLGRAYDNSHYSPSMQQNIKLAREIYNFIEEYDAEDWLGKVRFELHLPDRDIVRIKSGVDDVMERRYQMVLRWIRINQLNPDDAINRLKAFQNPPRPSPTPIVNSASS